MVELADHVQLLEEIETLDHAVVLEQVEPRAQHRVVERPEFRPPLDRLQREKQQRREEAERERDGCGPRPPGGKPRADRAPRVESCPQLRTILTPAWLGRPRRGLHRAREQRTLVGREVVAALAAHGTRSLRSVATARCRSTRTVGSATLSTSAISAMYRCSRARGVS